MCIDVAPAGGAAGAILTLSVPARLIVPVPGRFFLISSFSSIGLVSVIVGVVTALYAILTISCLPVPFAAVAVVIAIELAQAVSATADKSKAIRSEEHTSELQ